MFSLSRGEPHNAAQKRYLRRFFPAMGAYVVLLMFSTWAIKQQTPSGLPLFVLSLLPSLPLVAAIGVMGAYLIEERDEFIRTQLVTAMIGGLGIMLGVTTVWGFLENGGAVSHFPTFLTFPLWCGSFGLWNCAAKLRERLAGPDHD